MSAAPQVTQPVYANNGNNAELDRLLNRPVTAPGFESLESFELLQRQAKMLAFSSLVPKEYKDNIGNCAIALNMARRLNADPIMVMQHLYIVHGRPSWSSQFLISTLNTCGKFSSIEYEFVGTEGKDDYGCRAVATRLKTNQRLVGETITVALAKSEGWYSRNGSKWVSMTGQMLRYRAASWFVRVYAPELSMGLPTADEVFDSDTQEQIEHVGTSDSAVAQLRDPKTASKNSKKESKTTETAKAKPRAEPEPEPAPKLEQKATPVAEPESKPEPEPKAEPEKVKPKPRQQPTGAEPAEVVNTDTGEVLTGIDAIQQLLDEALAIRSGQPESDDPDAAIKALKNKAGTLFLKLKDAETIVQARKLMQEF